MRADQLRTGSAERGYRPTKSLASSRQAVRARRRKDGAPASRPEGEQAGRSTQVGTPSIGRETREDDLVRRAGTGEYGW